MRELFLIISLVFVSSLVSAEQMQFVTTLSHPVGTFATVEALDATKTVQSLQVNFCNQKVSTGSIQLKGAMRAAYLKTLANTQLGGSVPAYQLKTLYLGNYNTLTGGNVIANTANPAKADVSGTLYGPDMTYLVAELPALKIKDGSNVNANIKSGGSGTELQWSNKYECNYSATNTEDSAGVWEKEGTAVVVVNPMVMDNECDEKLNVAWDGKGEPFTNGSSDTCSDVFVVSSLTKITGDLCDKSWEPCPFGVDAYPLNKPENGTYDEFDRYWKSASYVLNDVYWKTEIKNFGGWTSPYTAKDASWFGCEVDMDTNVENCSRWNIMFTGVYKKQKWKKKSASGEEKPTCSGDTKYSSYLLKSKSATVPNPGGGGGDGGSCSESYAGEADRCNNCGGVWSTSKCMCDCGYGCTYKPQGGGGACLCGGVYKSCR